MALINTEDLRKRYLFHAEARAEEEINQIIREVKKYDDSNDKFVPKIRHCRDCKHWKDSDGVFRRGVGAESRCPINHKEVYEGNGYCFMFESQESEVEK